MFKDYRRLRRKLDPKGLSVKDMSLKKDHNDKNDVC